MSTFRQFDLLVINDYVTDIYRFAPHGHTYYELIYILKGKGIHLLNNNRFSYQSGDLYLVAPNDQHHFEVKQATRFVVIKFTEDYFSALHQTRTDKDLVPQVIMQTRSLKETKVSFSPTSALSLKNTVENIIRCKDAANLVHSIYVYHQLLSIFGLIHEMLDNLNKQLPTGKTDKQQVIAYIHQNIYDPQKCQILTIARHFNTAVSYFSDYFKRNFDISYRAYLDQYRIRLIESRIKGGCLSMKQIAAEFGFNDESHFSNYFKKHRKLRPTTFKANLSKAPNLP